MLLELCTFVTAVLGLLLIWAEEHEADVEGGMLLWSFCYNLALIGIRAVAMFVWYGRSVTFFKDTILLSEETTRIGATFVSATFALVCSFGIEYVMTRIQKVQAEATEDNLSDRATEIFLIFIQPLFDLFDEPSIIYVASRDYFARIYPPLAMIGYFFLHQFQKCADDIFLPPPVSETVEILSKSSVCCACCCC